MLLQGPDTDGGRAGSCERRHLPPAAGIRNRRERAIQLFWFCTALTAIFAIAFILLFLIGDSLPVFSDVGITQFLTGTTWYPTGDPPEYGVAVLITGTVLVTLGAMVFAVPLSIGCAIFIAELAPPKVKGIVTPAIELLPGIPSVVSGFFGLVVLTDAIRIVFGIPTGETWLAGSLLLGIMALPTIISISEDAISMVPREYREGSLAIGASRGQTISQVRIPGALSGITAAIILGFGRAIGETMAVMMVTGNSALVPDPIWNILSPVRTLTGTLGIEMGEVAVGGEHYAALFGVAVVLLVITLIVNSSAVIILERIRKRQTGRSATGKQSVVFGAAHAGFNRVFRRDGRCFPYCYYTLIIAVAVALMILLVMLLQDIALKSLPVIPTAFLAGEVNGFHWFWFVIAIIAALGGGILISNLKDRLTPRQAERVAFSLVIAAAAIVLLILVIILQDIIVHGLPAISWEFLTEGPKDLGRAGGIFPAIVGTICLVAGAILFALPLGIGAAIYLIEYTREGRITRLIRTTVDLLNGTPSIVFGLFGLAFLVYFLNFGVSLLAGQITLGLMVLPTIIRATEESLKTIPQSLREGSLALGATQWQTIYKVVLPPAIPGIVTGTILSIGRAAGETAPIMFTAVVFSQRYLPSSVFEPVMALPYHLFILATNVPGSSTNKYGTALVLLILVVGIYSVAIYVRNHFTRKLRG